MSLDLNEARLACVLACLIAASIFDLMFREVPWQLSLCVLMSGACLGVVEYAGVGLAPFLLGGVCAFLFYVIGLVSARLPLHVLGGGDAKLLAAISFALPLPPLWSLGHGVTYWSPAFPLTIFVNAVLFSLPLFIVFKRNVPFVVCILLGFVTSVLYGDVLLNCVSSLLC